MNNFLEKKNRRVCAVVAIDQKRLRNEFVDLFSSREKRREKGRQKCAKGEIVAYPSRIQKEPTCYKIRS